MTEEQQQKLASDILNCDTASPAFERAKTVLMQATAKGLLVRIETLDATIQRASAGSEAVARRLFWLNCAIAAATTIGAVATAFQAYAVFSK